MYDFIKHYENPNKFNEDIIKNFRVEDDMVEYLVDICKAQANSLPGVTFDGYEVEHDESKIKAINSVSGKVPITNSRVSLVTFFFTIKFKDEVEKIVMPILYPKLIDNYYFILNGNKYYAIYQNVDVATYNTRASVILKSLLMPIIIKSEIFSTTDMDGKDHNIRIYQLNLFKKRNNFLMYFFPEFGFQGTLEFFGYDKAIKIVSAETYDKKKNNINEIVFQINKQAYLIASRKRFETDDLFKSIVGCLLSLLSKKIQIGKIYDQEYWKIKLGQTFTTNSNAQVTKAESVVLSFRRILDDRTRKNLRIPDECKTDVFVLVKWMLENFEDLLRMDNLSLNNKRMRLAEYQCNGFNRRISTNAYRVLNKKTLTMQAIKSAFRIPANIIISDLQTSDLMRYSNAVNDMDVFGVATKYSNRGPASMGESAGKTISNMYRAIHISHLGRLSLNSCSASDPGMSGNISPFIKTDRLYYNTSEITANAFDIDDEELDDLE